MSFFGGGKSNFVADIFKIDPQLRDYFVPQETVEAAFKVSDYYVIFTDLRVILLQISGIAVKKREYQFIPYRCIVSFKAKPEGGSFVLSLNVLNEANAINLVFTDSGEFSACIVGLSAKIG